MTFVAVIFPLSSIVAPEFCISLPVVVSKRAIALSVAEAGQTTSPLHPPEPLAAAVIRPLLSTVIFAVV